MSTLRHVTWGISGGQFALAYGAALVALIIMLGVRRLRLLNPNDRGARRAVRPLTVDELAYLSGGMAGLASSALVGLHERGEVSSSTRFKVVADAVALSDAATPVQRALHRELSLRGSYPARQAVLLIGKSTAVEGVQRSLADAGLITQGPLRSRLRRAALAYFVLFVLGVARLIAGAADHRPMTFLVLLMVATAIAGLLSLRVPPVTAAGHAALRDARTEQESMRRASLPGERALAVALFGTVALWLAEPALADELGLAQARAVPSGSDGAD